MIYLDAAEQQAINAFLSESWEAFERQAEDYLTQEEIEKLGEKLSEF